MTTFPKTVRHHVTGEQITFLETASETQGKHLLIEVMLPPHGDGPPLHIHHRFREEFEVLEGRLKVQVGNEQHTLESGGRIGVPIGTAHTFRNDHEDSVTFRVRLTPPSQFEESVRIHYGLMKDGLCNSKGIPNKITYTALILSMQNTLVQGKPLWLQRALFGLLIRIGKMTKAYQSLEKYTGKPIDL